MQDNVSLFDRGKTYFGTGNTINTSDYGQTVIHEGKSRIFADTDPSDPLKKRSHRDVYAICVRNVSGLVLMPGRAVVWASGYRGKRIDGWSSTTAQEIAGVVDDHYGIATGIRNGDLFWLVVSGPVLMYTPLTPDAANIWAAGDPLYALTSATTGGNTVGATTTQDAGAAACWKSMTATSTETTDGTAGNKAINHFARAMSSMATSGVTLQKRMVDMCLAI